MWTEGRPTLAQKVLTIKADEGIAQEVSIVEDRKRKIQGRSEEFIMGILWKEEGFMKKLNLFAVLAFFLIFSISAFPQSKETGAISGAVADQQGAPIPGVTVTVSGPNLMGIRSAITEADGTYRFPALPPGEYVIRAELDGFKTIVRENIRLTTTTRLTIDIAMEQSAIEEEVTVVAQAPTVDVKSSETASLTLSDEILRNIPYSQFSADIVTLAPGVSADNVAYGASSNTGIAYSMDGVNVADPEAGSAWVFLDHNIVEEAKIMGIGLPAEYGNFTGVIFNIVTKSGGNQLSGHFELDFQGASDAWPHGFWQSDNNGAYIKDFPGLTSPLQELLDLSGHLGGPIMKDKLWFYAGLQWYRDQSYPTGFAEPLDYKEPHSFLKLTSQVSPKTNLMASLEVDAYNGINRSVFGFDHTELSLNTTLTQKSPEVVGNFTLTQIFGSKSFLDLKAAFFWGYYYLDPEMGMETPGRFLQDQNKWVDNAYHYGYYDRTRFQVNASYTHYVEDFIAGDHDFKFGVEAERSFVRNRFGYTGSNHTYYIDYAQGEPYLAYQYEGYDTNTYYIRLEGFLQDSWQITPRLNINAGLRLSQNWGTVKDVDGVVFNTFRLAPRVGFTFDIFGDKTTVLKAHYGQFTEAMLTSYHTNLNPSSAFSDFIAYKWDGAAYVEDYRIVPENKYKMADGIKHPYMNQFTVGLERELFKDASVGVSYINRAWKNIIGTYNLKSDFEPYEIFVPEMNRGYQIFQQTEDTVGLTEYVIANIAKGMPWISVNPHRKYWGLEFLFNKRFSNRWQLLLSYVYSKAAGTMDNEFGHDVGWSERDGLTTADPNYWINAEGNSTYDPTHMLKIQGTYVLPLDISFNAYFRAITGNAWTTRYRTDYLNQGRVTFYAEPRGSNHHDIAKILDVRLEKVFNLAKRYRLGVLLDAFNVFNSNTITNWASRIGYDYIPGSYASSQGHELYDIVTPRQFRVGVRLMF